MTETPIFNSIYSEETYRVSGKTVIVLPCPWSEVGDEYLQPLSKILRALKLSLESVQIIQQTTFDLSVFADKPKRMIAFVKPPKGIALYEPYVTGNTSIVFADGLDVLIQDEATKRKLWDALLILFSS